MFLSPSLAYAAKTNPAKVQCTKYWSGTVGACLPKGWEALDRTELLRARTSKDVVAGIKTDIPLDDITSFVTIRYGVLDSVDFVSNSQIVGYEEVETLTVNVGGRERTLRIFDALAKKREKFRYYEMNNGISLSDKHFAVTMVTPTDISSSDYAEIIAFYKSLTFKKPKARDAR